MSEPLVCATLNCQHPPQAHWESEGDKRGCRVTGCGCRAWTSVLVPFGEPLETQDTNLTIGLPVGRKVRVTIEVDPA